MRINGLAAIITGGSSGLGAATARHLAANGAKVAILDVNMDLARTVASDVGGIAVECDVSSGATCSEKETEYITKYKSKGADDINVGG